MHIDEEFQSSSFMDQRVEQLRLFRQYAKARGMIPANSGGLETKSEIQKSLDELNDPVRMSAWGVKQAGQHAN